MIPDTITRCYSSITTSPQKQQESACTTQGFGWDPEKGREGGIENGDDTQGMFVSALQSILAQVYTPFGVLYVFDQSAGER